jgi:hypothetical protein
MSTRTSGDLVKAIFDTDYTAAQLAPFVRTANIVVNTHLTGKGLSSDVLKEVETYLAAHFATLDDPRVKTEKIGNEYSATYQGETGMGFSSSHYGQMALMLDSSNSLASLGKKRARIRVLRTPAHGTEVRND